MDRPQTYHIRTRGHLQRHLLVHFDLQNVSHTEAGDTEICGSFDQANLRGLLTHLGDLGVVLVAVNLTHIDEE